MRKCKIQKEALESKRRQRQRDINDMKEIRKFKERVGKVITRKDYPSEHTRHGKGKF